ncbi:unnamed protein product [Caretta caretta]
MPDSRLLSSYVLVPRTSRSPDLHLVPTLSPQSPPGTPPFQNVTCGAPPEVTNATIVNNEEGRYLPGARVQYKCQEGFESMGLNDVTCEDGEWSQPPTCQEAAGKCGYPPAVDNGDIMVFPQEEYEPGSKVEYKCQHFYRMNGSASVSLPVCEQPPDVDFGEIISGEKSQYVESDSVQYGCYPGYTLAGSEWITCYGRNWMPPPKCLDVLGKCGPPPSSQNGDIISDLLPVYAAGSSVEYKCQSFHGMTGSKIITCHLGKWTAPPVCSDMRCAPPPEIYDGRILGAKQQRYLPGDRMHYQCGRGLSFIGSLTVTCEEGKWSQMPECKGTYE